MMDLQQRAEERNRQNVEVLFLLTGYTVTSVAAAICGFFGSALMSFSVLIAVLIMGHILTALLEADREVGKALNREIEAEMDDLLKEIAKSVAEELARRRERDQL